MVYRMQPSPGGLGATKAEKQADKESKASLRRATLAAEDEWKRYVTSLNNLVSQLRSGGPPDSPLPSAPASPADMAPHLFKQAQNIIQTKLPKAYEIAGTLARARGVRDAVSSYAAGAPPQDPAGNYVNSGVPSGDLPGNVQQPITTAYGATPVLDQGPPAPLQMTQGGGGGGGGGQGPYTGEVVDPGQINEQMYLPGGEYAPKASGSSPMKKILIVAAVGLAAYLAWRWWKGRKG